MTSNRYDARSEQSGGCTDLALTQQGGAVSTMGGYYDCLPVMKLQEAKQRFQMMAQFVRDLMVSGRDFGSIPGTGDKPTLLKPGAEKLMTFFGLRSQFEVARSIEDFDKGLFYYAYRCRLFRGDREITCCEGSANSYEKKYRWRNVPEYKASQDEKQRAVRTETRRGQRGDYRVLVLENDDPFTLVNTLQKMAQKRALIAATLIAVNASEFFTQDVEDIVEAEYEERYEAPQREAAPPPQPTPPPRGDDSPIVLDKFLAYVRELGFTPAFALEEAKKLGAEALDKLTVGQGKQVIAALKARDQEEPQEQ